MKPSVPTVVSILVLLVLFGSYHEVFGQDRCSDILRNGTFAKSNYKSNTYLRRILYTRFASMSYQETKSNTILGMTVPVGQEVMGNLDYSNAEYEAKKRDIESVKYTDFTDKRELEIALSSGDPVIVDAWTKCMQRVGGLMLTAEPMSSTIVAVSLRYARGELRENSVRLARNVFIEKGKIVDNRECLRRWKKLSYESKTGCTALIELPNAFATTIISASAGGNDVTAFVPPRVERRTEVADFAFAQNCANRPDERTLSTGPFGDHSEYSRRCPDRLLTTAFRTNKMPVYVVRLSQEQKAAGWRFKTGSGKIRLDRIWRVSMNNCAEEYISVTPFEVTYGYHIWGHSRGNSSKHGSICAVEPSVQIERDIWAPNDVATTAPAN